jgi:hypothetical protein
MTFAIVRASVERTLKNTVVRGRELSKAIRRSRALRNIIFRKRELP